ncbi:hypothetical protein DOY81_010208 [Sarcophaga bullata]|nr:hypothetical protein DOY81_010208 [Sarcophaga bullata]
MLNEGMEALRQIATTSLFMQNEQKSMTNRIVPIIREPENLNADILEASSDNKQTPEDSPTLDTTKRHNIVSSPNAAINKSTTNTAVYQAPLKQSEEKEVVDCAVSTNNGFSSKLSRQRISVHQSNPAVNLLSQQNLVALSESSTQEMETSLMFVRNPKLANDMLTPQAQPITTATIVDATVSNLNYSIGDNTLIPPIHAPSNAAKISLLTARPANAGSLSTTTSTTNTASTYAAALAAAISSRGNTERTEGLIRGPLGMPMHVLAASSSTYALPASAPSTCQVKTSTSAPLPAPSTAPPTLTTNTNESASNIQCIPGQVVQNVPFMGNAITTVPNQLSAINEPSYSSTTLKFPAASMLSSTYSGSSSTLSPNSLIGSTSFTTPTTQTTAGAKYEPELLLSPAKLGQ